jgi:hypothetical protein
MGEIASKESSMIDSSYRILFGTRKGSMKNFSSIFAKFGQLAGSKSLQPEEFMETIESSVDECSAAIRCDPSVIGRSGHVRSARSDSRLRIRRKSCEQFPIDSFATAVF